MEKFRAKLPSFSMMTRWEKLLLVVCLALVVALIVVVCVSANIRVNMHREYTGVRNSLGESLRSDMSMMIQTFNMTTVPNAPLRDSVIPQMKNYFIAASTLNDALTQCFGPQYRVMTDADISAISNAFNAYESALRSDGPTDLAQADMLACMNRLSELLNARFSGGTLRAAR